MARRGKTPPGVPTTLPREMRVSRLHLCPGSRPRNAPTSGPASSRESTSEAFTGRKVGRAGGDYGRPDFEKAAPAGCGHAVLGALGQDAWPSARRPSGWWARSGWKGGRRDGMGRLKDGTGKRARRSTCATRPSGLECDRETPKSMETDHPAHGVIAAEQARRRRGREGRGRAAGEHAAQSVMEIKPPDESRETIDGGAERVHETRRLPRLDAGPHGAEGKRRP